VVGVTGGSYLEIGDALRVSLADLGDSWEGTP